MSRATNSTRLPSHAARARHEARRIGHLRLDELDRDRDRGRQAQRLRRVVGAAGAPRPWPRTARSTRPWPRAAGSRRPAGPWPAFTTAVTMSGKRAAASAQADWSPEIITTGAPKWPQTAPFRPISPVGCGCPPAGVSQRPVDPLAGPGVIEDRVRRAHAGVVADEEDAVDRRCRRLRSSSTGAGCRS